MSTEDEDRMVSAQPMPKQNDLPAIWDLVIADMRERDNIGVSRYGTRLQPHNGRDCLIDAYQEALDLAVYLRQTIYERDEQTAEKNFKDYWKAISINAPANGLYSLPQVKELCRGAWESAQDSAKC